MKVPASIVAKLYTRGSLKNEVDGVGFSLKNRLIDASLTRVVSVCVDDKQIPPAQLFLEVGEGERIRGNALDGGEPIPFPVSQEARVKVLDLSLEEGMHEIRISLETRPFGAMEIKARDSVGPPAAPARATVPYVRDVAADHSAEMVARRQAFVERHAGVRLQHLKRFSFDPAITRSNCENFTGVAQVPIGFAGPLEVNGEHARGEFLIPLATTEGTLVASFSRGMKILNESGGVSCTVADDRMQRAPGFVFDSARAARNFRDWVKEHEAEIRTVAEATSRVARLLEIETYLTNKFAFLRFNYSTGDAAGQNMVGKATFAAVAWIAQHAPGITKMFLESNLATDKKPSHINMLRTRGKRVTAEVVIPRAVFVENLRLQPEAMLYFAGVGAIGTFMAGANNNGLHAANGLTALFIATGQDVANVAEGSAAIVYAELTREGDLYMSLTLPSLIVATHGGGTGLATQRECLEILGCSGKGKVNKFAEIVAGVALAGEISLAAAILSLEWVSAHESLGRNR